MSSRTPTYAETVRAELERQDSLDLQQRIAAGLLTEEAQTIAALILKQRGEPLRAPAPSLTQHPDSPKLQRKPRSGFLGLGVFVSLIGFGLLGNSATSLQYGLGAAFGQVAGASVLALPLFLVYRFFTSSGRSHSLTTGFNIYAALVAGVWFALVVLRVALPLAMHGH